MECCNKCYKLYRKKIIQAKDWITNNQKNVMDNEKNVMSLTVPLVTREESIRDTNDRIRFYLLCVRMLVQSYKLVSCRI